MITMVYVGSEWGLPCLRRLTLCTSHDAWWMEVRSQRVVNVRLPSQWLRWEISGGGRCGAEPPAQGRAEGQTAQRRGERGEERNTFESLNRSQKGYPCPALTVAAILHVDAIDLQSASSASQFWGGDSLAGNPRQRWLKSVNVFWRDAVQAPGLAIWWRPSVGRARAGTRPAPTGNT